MKLRGADVWRRCGGTPTHGPGETQDLIDGPLIIGMDPVLASEYLTVSREQKVGWQPQGTTTGPNGRHRSTLANNVPGAVEDGADNRQPSTRVE